MAAEHFGYKTSQHEIKTIVLVGKRLCQRKCDEHARCLSVNYSKMKLTCELSDVRAESVAGLLVSSEYTYISKQVNTSSAVNIRITANR